MWRSDVGLSRRACGEPLVYRTSLGVDVLCLVSRRSTATWCDVAVMMVLALSLMLAARQANDADDAVGWLMISGLAMLRGCGHVCFELR